MIRHGIHKNTYTHTRIRALWSISICLVIFWPLEWVSWHSNSIRCENAFNKLCSHAVNFFLSLSYIHSLGISQEFLYHFGMFISINARPLYSINSFDRCLHRIVSGRDLVCFVWQFMSKLTSASLLCGCEKNTHTETERDHINTKHVCQRYTQKLSSNSIHTRNRNWLQRYYAQNRKANRITDSFRAQFYYDYVIKHTKEIPLEPFNVAQKKKYYWFIKLQGW